MAENSPDTPQKPLVTMPLVNAKTQEIEQLPYDQAEQAFVQGSHNLLPGEPVNVVNPSGKLVSLSPTDVPEALKSGYRFPTEQQAVEQKFGHGLNPAKAAARAAVSAATFGASRKLESELSKVGVGESPEQQRGEEEANPIASGAGTAAGIIAPLFLAPEAVALRGATTALKAAEATGDAAKIAEAAAELARAKTAATTIGGKDVLNPVGLVSKIGRNAGEATLAALPEATTIAGKAGTHGVAGIIGGLTEGALYGAGQSLDENALGNHDLLSQQTLNNITIGGAFSGALGGLMGGFTSLLPEEKAAAKVADDVAKNPATKFASPAEAYAATFDQAPAGEKTIIDATAPQKGIKTTTLDENLAQYRDAIKRGDFEEMPQKQHLIDAANSVPLEHQVDSLQANALNSQGDWDTYRTATEMPGELGDAYRFKLAKQKAELTKRTDDIIQSLNPTRAPITDRMKAGENAADSFTNVIEQNRKELGPKIAEIKNIDSTKDHLPGIVDYLTNPETSQYANPKLAQFFDTTKPRFEMTPWDSGSGVSKKTYQNVKEMLTDLEKDPTNFGRLFDLRKAVGEGVNLLETGDASRELTKVKAAMMDYIQGIAQEESEDPNVRDWFRKYAINEENAKYIEQKFGAEIGSDNFRSLAKDKPEENILNNIFRDTKTIRAAKNILPPEKFNELLSDFLAIQREAATEDGAFSSRKFFSQNLKRKADVMNEAFETNPQALKELQSYNTISRILPDRIPVNPSGTTKTLFNALSLSPFEFAKNIGDMAKDRIAMHQTIDKVNAALSNNTAKSTYFSKLLEAKKKTEAKIVSGVKSVLRGTATFAETESGKIRGPVSALIDRNIDTKQDQLRAYNKKTEEIVDLMASPEALHSRLEAATNPIYELSPKMAASLQKTMLIGYKFLDSKIPKIPPSGPLGFSWTPSTADVEQFNRYYNAVQKPTSVLQLAAEGTLTDESVEALRTVHPELYQQMSSHMIDELADADVEEIPYRQKQMMGLFLGRDLDGTTTPQILQSNQAVFAQKQAQNSAPQGAVRTSQTGLSKLTLSNRSQTTAQETAVRDRA